MDEVAWKRGYSCGDGSEINMTLLMFPKTFIKESRENIFFKISLIYIQYK